VRAGEKPLLSVVLLACHRDTDQELGGGWEQLEPTPCPGMGHEASRNKGGPAGTFGA
jgi:hypothetical protein